MSKLKKREGAFFFCCDVAGMTSALALLCAVAVAVEGAFLSLDSDVTSEAGSGATAERLSIHKMLTASAVGLQLEVESEGGAASPRVLAEGVGGTAVTVRQFRRGSKTATVVAVMAPLGSAISHAALLGEGGRSLKYMRVGHTTVEVTQEADGGIELVVLPDSGRTRPRPATVTQMGEEMVETYNTAIVDMHSGQLRPGFAVKLRRRGAGPTTSSTTSSTTETSATSAAPATRRPREKRRHRDERSHRRRHLHREEKQRRRESKRRHRKGLSHREDAESSGPEKESESTLAPGVVVSKIGSPKLDGGRRRAGDAKLNFSDTESLDMDILSEESPKHLARHLPLDRELDHAPSDEVADLSTTTTEKTTTDAPDETKPADATPKKKKEKKQPKPKKRKLHVGVKFQLEEDEQSINKAIQAAEKADAATKKPADSDDPKVKLLFAEALSNQEEAEKLASMP
jgi:hypothetical protein